MIKVASILLGTLVAVGRGGERGFLTGMTLAALYMVLGYGCYAFLGGRISFGRIPEIVSAALDAHGALPARSLEDIDRADALARETAQSMIE